ncbi:MAG: 3-dehydroquinate synthase, partial [Myxococcota bacterium]|nr:3-dehydroquinate synthase [Myxococcota bacterium]
AGMSIPDIFKQSGEVAFRARERQALRSVLQREEPTIIATGGGTFIDDTMRTTLAEHAVTLYLETDVATLMSRLSTEGEVAARPMLKGPEPAKTVERLLEKRGPIYQRADQRVTTTARGVDDVVNEIIRSLKLEPPQRGSRSERVSVPAASSSSPVREVSGGVTVKVEASRGDYDVMIRGQAGPWIAEGIAERARGSKVAVITDTTVARLHAHDLVRELKAVGKDVQLIQVDPGEGSKSLGTASRLYDHLLTQKLTRSDSVVALGGGVVGDLAGFVASTFLRGVGFFQVPTTTLSCVDSSVGGKTAVNTPRGKNLIGTFYPAEGVFIAVSHIATQSRHEHAAGLVESLKMAAALDAAEFEMIVAEAESLLSFDVPAVTRAIAASVSLKAKVVSEDERESGIRAVLNYGHTVGHAIEAGENFQMLHGEAVGLGMVAESQWAEMEGQSSHVSAKIRSGIEALGLRTDWRRKKIDIEALGVDKKRVGSGVRLPIVTTLGTYDLRTVPVSALVEFVKRRSVS